VVGKHRPIDGGWSRDAEQIAGTGLSRRQIKQIRAAAARHRLHARAEECRILPAADNVMSGGKVWEAPATVVTCVDHALVLIPSTVFIRIQINLPQVKTRFMTAAILVAVAVPEDRARYRDPLDAEVLICLAFPLSRLQRVALRCKRLRPAILPL